MAGSERKVSVRLSVEGKDKATSEVTDFADSAQRSMDDVAKSGDAGLGAVGDAATGMADNLDEGAGAVDKFVDGLLGGEGAAKDFTGELVENIDAVALLSGAAGVVIGVLGAMAVQFLQNAANAETFDEKVETLAGSVGDLEGRVSDLKAANDVFSTEGVEQLTEKYGELNDEITLLVTRQADVAEALALEGAEEAARDLLDVFSEMIMEQKRLDLAEARGGIAAGVVEMMRFRDEFGFTIEQARDLNDAFSDVLYSEGPAQMADGLSTIYDIMQDAGFEGAEFYQTILDTEAAVRELSNEADGIGTWLDSAIEKAGTMSAAFWDAVRAKNALEDEPENSPDRVLQRQMQAYGLYGNLRNQTLEGQRAPAGAIRPSSRPTDIDFGVPDTDSGAGGGGGGGKSEAEKATQALERDAARIIRETRTEAEQYKIEMARLNEVKAAGLIDGETFNRQQEALAEKYKDQSGFLDQIIDKLDAYTDRVKDFGSSIGDVIVDAFEAGEDAVGNFVENGKLDMDSLRAAAADIVSQMLVDFAKLSAAQYIFQPAAAGLSSALGGLFGAATPATVSHDGSMAGSGLQRSVPAALFANATRLHSGGMAGDEYPHILQRGERVLNRQETRDYNRGGSSPTVIFNVKDAASVNQSRTQIAADASRALSAGQRGR